VKGLKAETVTAAVREVFHGEGPLVFLATPQPVQGGDQAVLAAFTAAQQVAVAPPAEPKQVAWPYEDFGPPGKVAETRTVADLGVTFYRFENGVRLTVKPTKFKADQVLVQVNVGDGMLDLPADQQSPYWASNAYIEGGLKRIDVEDMERVLAAKLYGARFRIGDDSFELSGQTRPADLLTQMQVLAAYATEPAWRENAFLRIKGAGKTIHDQYDSTDQGVMARALQGLIHSGDRRWTFPSREEIATAELSDISGPITAAMAKGPLEVVIVGDVTPEAARDAVARTFGALPARPSAPSIDDAQRKVAFPQGVAQPIVLTHKGRADQSIGYVAWPTTDYWEDPARAQATAVMGEVLRLRVLDQLREQEGATYSPQVSYTHSQVWRGWGYMAVAVEVPPAKLAGFFADVEKIAADLASREVSPDELERAKQPRIEQFEKAQVTNGYWLNDLSGAQWDPRKLEFIRNYIEGTKKVTAADVRRSAQTFLKPERAFKIEVVPASLQAATTAASSP
jgi:zinc protease